MAHITRSSRLSAYRRRFGIFAFTLFQFFLLDAHVQLAELDS